MRIYKNSEFITNFMLYLKIDSNVLSIHILSYVYICTLHPK